MISDEIKNNISSLSNDDLIDLLVNSEGYTKEALLHADKEILKRNLSTKLEQKRIIKRSLEKEVKNFIKENTEGRFKRLYFSIFSFAIGVIAAFVLYRNFQIMGNEVFSIADARSFFYERPYCNLMLLIFNIFIAFGGILSGIVGLIKHCNNR